jgi:hypothetical protein
MSDSSSAGLALGVPGARSNAYPALATRVESVRGECFGRLGTRLAIWNGRCALVSRFDLAQDGLDRLMLNAPTAVACNRSPRPEAA